MHLPASDPANPAARRGLIAAIGLALLLVYAWIGGDGFGAGLMLGLVGVFVLALVPRLPASLALVFLPLTLLTPPVGGWKLFDAAIPVLAVAATIATLRHDRPGSYEVHGPGLIVLLMLLFPLPGLLRIQSLVSYLGSYKELLATGVVFLSLRRLVPREKAAMLLWALPVLGLGVSAQLLLKTQGLGALQDRIYLRNFYTNLGWGQSNAVAATLLVCLCGTALLFVIERRLLPRLGLVAAMAVMMRAFLIPSSRSAAVSLAVFLAFLVLGLKGGLRSLALRVLAVVAIVQAISRGGRALVTRFADVSEYASWTERQGLWDMSWNRFVDSPLVGIGLNQGRFQGDSMAEARAHNMILDLLMEWGVLGGVFFALCLFAMFRLCLRAAPGDHPDVNRNARVTSFAFVTAVILQSLVEPTFFGYGVTFPFVWFLAWLTLVDGRAKRNREATADAAVPASSRGAGFPTGADTA